eukprot:2414692-Rhodomonas_salina.1
MGRALVDVEIDRRKARSFLRGLVQHVGVEARDRYRAVGAVEGCEHRCQVRLDATQSQRQVTASETARSDSAQTAHRGGESARSQTAHRVRGRSARPEHSGVHERKERK